MRSNILSSASIIKTLRRDWPVFVVLSLIIGWISYKQSRLDHEGRYTVGTTEGRNGKNVKFVFQVNGITYHGEYPIQRASPDVSGGRYLVRFLPSDPGVNRIDFSREFKFRPAIPDSGWEKFDEGWFLDPPH